MRYSKSLIKTLKETPREADSISSALLLRGGYIDQEMRGVYTLLPLGFRVIQKISQIIREEMDKIGGQELLMPTLQPKELWQETGRWETIDPPLFKFKDRHEKDLTIGPTHEEVITDIIRDRILSKKDLPQMIYQIQTKFRNELRATGGLLRVIEFLMKDAYSFHATADDFDEYYQKIATAYREIFKRVGVEVRMVEAHSGSIGGKRSSEFMLISETGEDKIFLCGACDYAVNAELTTDVKTCPACGGQIKEAKAIEVAHIFDLGDLYSKKMDALFTDTDGAKKPILMGCYGIGIGRLAASVVEASHDEKGIIWPGQIAPYKVVLIDLTKSGQGEEFYQKLLSAGIEVLFDDREEVAAGVKFADADLLGFPYRMVISDKIGEGKVELKKRDRDDLDILTIDKVLEHLIK